VGIEEWAALHFVSRRAKFIPPLEAAGFLLQHRLPDVLGLTSAPQAFYFAVYPTAKV